MKKISSAQSVVSSGEVKASGALQWCRGRGEGGAEGKLLSVSGSGKVKGSSDFGGREKNLFLWPSPPRGCENGATCSGETGRPFVRGAR